jgi:hypothetical protein
MAMKPSVRAALEIASLPTREFNKRIYSGEFSQAQIKDALGLRGALLTKRKPTLGERLAAEGNFVTVHITKSEQHEEENTMPTLEDKIERGRRMQKHIITAIDEIVKRDGVSRARAAEIVSYSPEMREMLDLERREDEVLKSGATRDTTNLPRAKPQGGMTTNTTTMRQQLAAGVLPQPAGRPGLYPGGESVSSLRTFNTGGSTQEGEEPEGESAADMLETAAKAIMVENPSMRRGDAYDAAMRNPRVRKAYDAERQARLAAASRLHG